MDIATSALPAQVMSLFAHTVPTGLQHGTVTVIAGRGGPAFEVTTFRTESGYSDYRRPGTVAFVTSLEADLQRRDFTMNAMAEGLDGQLVDPYGGRDDLARGVLRCVGDAAQRFGEDALRMLRCVRFAAAYGLEVEAGTRVALRAQAPLLRHIAMERCRAELERMVEGPHPVRALRLLADSGLWRHFKVPTGVDWGRWNELAGAAEELEPRWVALAPEVRWALLWTLLGVNEPAALQAMQALVFAKRRASEVAAVLGCDAWLAQRAAAGGDLRAAWKRAALRCGAATLRRWLALRATAAPQSEPLQACLRSGEAWLAEMPAASLGELAVGGAAVLAALGERGGPWLGELLQALLERVALGALANEPEPLLAEAQRLRQALSAGGAGPGPDAHL
jgi:tRNA nucleotidyltransferase (CCA-adding enzyme)